MLSDIKIDSLKDCLENIEVLSKEEAIDYFNTHYKESEYYSIFSNTLSDEVIYIEMRERISLKLSFLDLLNRFIKEAIRLCEILNIINKFDGLEIDPNETLIIYNNIELNNYDVGLINLKLSSYLDVIDYLKARYSESRDWLFIVNDCKDISEVYFALENILDDNLLTFNKSKNEKKSKRYLYEDHK